MCWMDIESFRGIPSSNELIRNIKAKKIRKDHLNKSYYFGSNSPAAKETQRMTMQAGGGNYGARLPARPSTPVLREVQKHVRARLEKRWLAEFMMSPEFVKRNRDTRLSGSWDRRMSTKFNQLSVSPCSCNWSLLGQRNHFCFFLLSLDWEFFLTLAWGTAVS